MKVSSLTAKNYRSLRDVRVEFDDLALFIGANSSGKSTILDALSFLSEGVIAHDFGGPFAGRGGMGHLPWKGQEVDRIELSVMLDDDNRQFEWSVGLVRRECHFYVEERLREIFAESPPIELLRAHDGQGWWLGQSEQKVRLSRTSSACALVAASADADFAGRQIAEFASQWRFRDPAPYILRDWTRPDTGWSNPHGGNLGATLYNLRMAYPEAFRNVVDATRSVVGLPNRINPKTYQGNYYFEQYEPGLKFPVSQTGVSSGTLRILALMTTLYGQPEANLIGIEEPENYVHPWALFNFAQHINEACSRTQFLITTHSPLLLSYLDEPGAVNIVKRDDILGTIVQKESNPDGVRKALEASGFGLGEYHETKGFGM